MSKNSNLKKKIGEKAYNFLSRNYNDDFLAEHLPSIFDVLSNIRYIQEEEYSKLKILLNEKFENKKEEVKKTTKTAKQLLDEAGFDLHDNIKEEKDYLIFEKYYKEGEKLCKFGSYNATERFSRLFWITRKNFEKIKRAEKPARQDEYSTSCMSVGIAEDKRNVMQICSRYNSTVLGCDNTYNSNLDNIVEGLTEAFNTDYNLRIKKSKSVEFDNFYLHENKFFHYHYEINGKKYGDNAIDGVYYDPCQFLIFENYILDLQKKYINILDDNNDYLINIVNDKIKNGDKIQISKIEKNIFLKIGSLEIEINKKRVIKLADNNLTSCGDYFLYYNKTLTTLELPNLTSCGDYFLNHNKTLATLELPNLTSCGGYFLFYNETLTTLELPNLTSCGNSFLYRNETLTNLELPNLTSCGDDFLYYNKTLTTLELPKLTSCGDDFLYYNKTLTTLDLPNLTSCGDDFLFYNETLQGLDNYRKLNNR